MKAYLISHEDIYGNRIARIFDDNFNQIDIEGVFVYSIIGNRIVGSVLKQNSIGSCRYELIDKFDFSNEVEANKFIKENNS